MEGTGGREEGRRGGVDDRENGGEGVSRGVLMSCVVMPSRGRVTIDPCIFTENVGFRRPGRGGHTHM